MKAVSLLEAALKIADAVRYEEQECLDNMPENLEGSYRYEKMENAVDKLEDAISNIEEACDALGEASE